MRILYDHQIFFSQKYGGISRYFYELITRIAKKADVDLFQGFNINKYGLNKYSSQYQRYMGFERPLIPKTGIIFNHINLLLLKKFVSNTKYNIYHPTYYNYHSVIKKEKLVVTVYDMIHEIFCKDFFNDRTSEKKKEIFQKADGIITISKNTKKDLINLLNIDEKKIKVIYLANSLTSPVNSKRIIKESYLLYVGNRYGYKNFDNFIKAFSLSKYKNDFKIICFGGGAFNQQEKKTLFDLRLDNKVVQLSGDDRILANLYYYSDIFIYPSKYEGFGIPPLESMYYGTPVIASNTSSIPEIMGDAGIYFNPDEVEDIREKIDMVLNNSEITKQLIEKGYNREKFFSWDKCAKETCEFYEDISLR